MDPGSSWPIEDQNFNGRVEVLEWFIGRCTSIKHRVNIYLHTFKTEFFEIKSSCGLVSEIGSSHYRIQNRAVSAKCISID